MAEDPTENPNAKLFSLAEAEKTRRAIEPRLAEAIEHRRRALDFERRIEGLVRRIQFSGGLAVRHEKALELRRGFEGASERAQAVVTDIESTGCVVKDLDRGLVDFPGRLNGEDVFWCWRLGEDHIRFWHRPEEGFAGRKPISPGDSGATPPVH